MFTHDESFTAVSKTGTLLLLSSATWITVGCTDPSSHVHDDAGATSHERTNTSAQTSGAGSTSNEPDTVSTNTSTAVSATIEEANDASVPVDADTDSQSNADGSSTPPPPDVDGSVLDASTGSPDAPQSSADAGSREAHLEQARAEYRDWEPRTENPINISVQIFALCRAPSAAEYAFLDSVHGDDLALQDWLNPEARAGIAAFESASDEATTTSFAVGATIVKEKLVLTEGGEYELAALGLMIKREAGFNPDNGNWQFGYWEPQTGMSSSTDDQTFCADCHALAGTDFVYVDDSWRLPE